jgi:hypothetical protein
MVQVRSCLYTDIEIRYTINVALINCGKQRGLWSGKVLKNVKMSLEFRQVPPD